MFQLNETVVKKGRGMEVFTEPVVGIVLFQLEGALDFRMRSCYAKHQSGIATGMNNHKPYVV